MPRNSRRKVVYAFIDSQNLHLSIKNLGWKLDFYKLQRYLHDEYKVSKAFIFIGQMSGQDELYAHLQNIGYTVVFKPTVSYTQGTVEKTKGNVDAELVLHCMIEYNNYDKAIIISGDGDFYSLAKYLKRKNKLLKIGIPNRINYSILLRDFANQHFYISGMRSKLEYHSRLKHKRGKIFLPSAKGRVKV
ncbi:MAG: hypothetical protein C3F02_00540 [Parcubacteria group bacterium]|nr:MAG: hypothetical protein C3F02_00540 [Parcubacteria group bacterium]